MASNSEQIPKLSDQSFERYISSAPKEAVANFMAKGSENMLVTGTGKTQVFKGMNARTGVEGGGVMMNVAETFASLGSAGQTAYGNVFNVFSALFYIGAGLLRLAGHSLEATASQTLSILIKRGGSYEAALSGPYQAGLAQPSAPIIRAITPPAGFEGKNNGVNSMVVWRRRSTTGARSVRSLVSNVAGAVNQSYAVKFPAPAGNGQDLWGLGVTQNGEGQTGAHFELKEILESEISYSRVTGTITVPVSSNIATASGSTFTSADIGRRIKGNITVSYDTWITGINSPTEAVLNDANNAGVGDLIEPFTITQAVEGELRTIAVEYRDGDLANKPFAPTRDFPPPAGLFGSTLEDVAYVDGAYADAVQSVGGDVKGAAIAPSERGRPESYSPDTVIFTSDQPTAILKGDGLDWRFGRNSLRVIRYQGGGVKNLAVEQVWTGVGILYQHNAVIGEGGRLYAWTGGRGLVRLGNDGLPDSSFANDVADDLKLCTDPAKRVLGWDGINQIICACYGKKIYPFLTSLNVWGAPLNLDGLIIGDIKSCVTDNDVLLLTADDGTTQRLYEFNVGNGTIAKVMTPWIPSRGMLDTVHSVVASVRADNTAQAVVIEVFADGDDSAPVSSQTVTPARTGYQRLLPVYPNVIDAESHAVRITICSMTTSGGCGIESVQTYGESNSIMR